jgi:15-cis-phytoene synthase
MTLQMHTWESSLLSLAQEDWSPAMALATEAVKDQALLAQAYEHCRRLTAAHSRSFYLASGLLPPPKRQAARALYAFCRTADDLVDRPNGDPQAALLAWQRRVLSPHPPIHNLVAVAWADTRTRYHIPPSYSKQLLAGVGRDITQHRYQTFADLTTYAYGVASTVGLMSMHIVGFTSPQALPYAIKLGVALQLTNILRDVGEDWRAGRVYLPQDELAAFGLTEADLAAGRVDNRWRAFMQFQISRDRQLYTEAWPGIGLLNQDGRLAIAAAAALYQAILADIEAHDYDVFRRRAYVGAWDKLRQLVVLWWQLGRRGQER